MSTQPPDGFTDNWTYLKTELNWLDRVLMVAVARQRQDKKQLDRMAQSRADRVSGHWWQGIVSLDGKVAYDEHRKAPPSTASKGSYQQQLEARIQASHGLGVSLALPSLCDRLKLSIVEKNTILICLAPEINRRYARIYQYLQNDEGLKTDLPTVDLVLRLLCRNDREWRAARQQLTPQSSLIQHNLLMLVTHPTHTFLTASLRLSNSLVEYLLTERPTPEHLDLLLVGSSTVPLWPQGASHSSIEGEISKSAEFLTPPIIAQPATFSTQSPHVQPHLALPCSSLIDIDEAISAGGDWSHLVVPEDLKTTLSYLCQQMQCATLNLNQQKSECSIEVVTESCDQSTAVNTEIINTDMIETCLEPPTTETGMIVILAGATGTGKTTSARAIAQTLNIPLHRVDLACIDPEIASSLLHTLMEQQPQLLLIQSAQLWLKRSSSCPSSALQQFFNHRRQHHGLTLFSVPRLETVSLRWQRQTQFTLTFPLPDLQSRYQLWQQAFPDHVRVSTDVNWRSLAQRFKLSGGEIMAIACESARYAAAVSAPQVEMSHILQALHQRGKIPARRSRPD
jgi:hypothetical protein